MTDVNIFDVYDFEQRLLKVCQDGTLEDCLKLLDVIYFEGSRKEGNENREVFEYSTIPTKAIEVLLDEERIRFWGRIGTGHSSDYFWKYIRENYPEVFDTILDKLVTMYFSKTPGQSIYCEIMANSTDNVFQRWQMVL